MVSLTPRKREGAGFLHFEWLSVWISAHFSSVSPIAKKGSIEHCNENPIYVFPEKNCAASVSVTTLMCLWAIYIFPGSVHIFSCSRLGRPVLGIYKSLTYSWGHAIPFLGIYICFKFSILFLCSEGVRYACTFRKYANFTYLCFKNADFE